MDRPRILWAADNADMREYVERLLGPLYDVQTVASGELALTAAQVAPPDLVLSDILLPTMDGFELLRRLRSDPKTREVPVILVSTWAGEESRLEGLGAGADDYLIKPFGRRELLARIGSVLTLARVRREAVLCEGKLRAELMNILESMTDGFMALDEEWRIRYVNAAAERTNGMSRESLLGRNFWEAFPAALGTEVERNLRHAMAERVALSGEVFYEPYGRWFAMDIHPTKERHLVFFARDVTEKKRAEETQWRLQRERDEVLSRLNLQFQRMPIACILFDAEYRISDWNPAAEAIFGHKREEVLGEVGPEILVPPGVREQTAKIRRRLAAGDMNAHSVNENITKDGRTIVCEWHNTPIRNAAGEVIALLAMAQDITERRLAEEKLFETQVRLAADLAAMTRLQEISTRLVPAVESTPLLLEIMDAAIAVTAADMGKIQLLDSASRTLHIVASRGFHQPFLQFFDTVHEGEATSGTTMREGRRIIVEDVTTSPMFAGSQALDVLLEAGVRAVQSTPLVARSGRLVGMLSTHCRSPHRPADRDLRILDLLARQAADWIERTQAEQALHASEERFRRYFDLGLIGMAITTPSQGVLEVNDCLCEILGYSRSELLHMTWAEITHPDDLAADQAQFARVLAKEIDGYSIDKRWIKKDGEITYTDISVNCVRKRDRSVDYFVALVQDITQRKQAEGALRESEERYRSLTAQVKDYAIFSTNELGVVTTWNEGCQQVLGYGQEELIGLDSAMLFTPEDRAAGVPADQLREAMDTRAIRNDRWMNARGDRRFYAMGVTTALTDPAGELIGFSMVLRDVTPMKLSQDALVQREENLTRLVTEQTDELQRTSERLRLSERMASLGTLSAGLGHDLGNLLLPIDVRLKLLLDADLAPELREHVNGIEKCTQYLQRLASGLRSLAIDPESSIDGEATELRRWLDDVGIILKNLLRKGITFEHRLPPGDCWVAIKPVSLTQVVFNLVQNSADALRERETGCVSLSAFDDPGAEMILLQVSDDGPGMAPEVIRRCMEPYFSTKPRGESTGMGLSFVHSLVTGAGGQVAVDSIVGQGTRITLSLRRANPADQTDADPPAAMAARSSD
jgi:PAS domain S-box-containing protein